MSSEGGSTWCVINQELHINSQYSSVKCKHGLFSLKSPHIKTSDQQTTTSTQDTVNTTTQDTIETTNTLSSGSTINSNLTQPESTNENLESKPKKRKRTKKKKEGEAKRVHIGIDGEYLEILRGDYELFLQSQEFKTLSSDCEPTTEEDNSSEDNVDFITWGETASSMQKFTNDSNLEQINGQGTIEAHRLFNTFVQHSQQTESRITALDSTFVLPPKCSFLMSDITGISTLIDYKPHVGFQLIVMDPPWENKSVSRSNKYQTLPNFQLFKLPVRQLCHNNGIVAVWVTNKSKFINFVKESLFPHWGVTYVSTWHWLKVTNDGKLVYPMDSTHKKPYEPIIIGTRATPTKSEEQLAKLRHHRTIISVPGSHSRKPCLKASTASLIVMLSSTKQYYKLDLSFHNLNEVPDEVYAQTELNELNLSYNQIPVLPPIIGTFTSLVKLSLTNNCLNFLPPEIGELVNLKELNLFNCHIKKLPVQIGNLVSLQELLLNGNDLDEIPPQISSLTALQGLDLENNKLTQLPVEIGALDKLAWLILDNNRIHHLPHTFGGLTSLERLYLDNNCISSLPHTITKITTLKWLYLENNPIMDSTLPNNSYDMYVPQQELTVPSLRSLTAKMVFDRHIPYITEQTKEELIPKGPNRPKMIPHDLYIYLSNVSSCTFACVVCNNKYFERPLEAIGFTNLLWYTLIPVSFYVCDHECARKLQAIREYEATHPPPVVVAAIEAAVAAAEAQLEAPHPPALAEPQAAEPRAESGVGGGLLRLAGSIVKSTRSLFSIFGTSSTNVTSPAPTSVDSTQPLPIDAEPPSDGVVVDSEIQSESSSEEEHNEEDEASVSEEDDPVTFKQPLPQRASWTTSGVAGAMFQSIHVLMTPSTTKPPLTSSNINNNNNNNDSNTINSTTTTHISLQDPSLEVDDFVDVAYTPSPPPSIAPISQSSTSTSITEIPESTEAQVISSKPFASSASINAFSSTPTSATAPTTSPTPTRSSNTTTPTTSVTPTTLNTTFYANPLHGTSWGNSVARAATFAILPPSFRLPKK